jgi:uncharacterized protein YndB with AHSA1/START domain
VPDFVRASRTFQATPEVVWGAVSDPRALARWLGDGDLQAIEGTGYSLQTPSLPGWSGRVAGEVNWVHEGRCIGFTWRTPELAAPTQVFIHVVREPTSTRVEVDHRGFSENGRRWWLAHQVGWRRLLARLADVIDEGSPGA